MSPITPLNKTKELMVTAKRVAAQMICKLEGEARAVDITKKQGLARTRNI